MLSYLGAILTVQRECHGFIEGHALAGGVCSFELSIAQRGAGSSERRRNDRCINVSEPNEKIIASKEPSALIHRHV